MEQPQIELVGVIKEKPYRKSSSESGYKECRFELESGERVFCHWFIPRIMKGWKVKIIGHWNESRKTFLADDVERFVEKLNYNQTKLGEFEK